MRVSDADAPKPPAYPFMNQQSQRAIVRQKTCDPPTSWRIPSRLVFRFSERLLRVTVTSVRHRRVSVSVRRYLRRRRGARKREKCMLALFFRFGGFLRKIAGLLRSGLKMTWPLTPQGSGVTVIQPSFRPRSGCANHCARPVLPEAPQARRRRSGLPSYRPCQPS